MRVSPRGEQAELEGEVEGGTPDEVGVGGFRMTTFRGIQLADRRIFAPWSILVYRALSFSRERLAPS